MISQKQMILTMLQAAGKDGLSNKELYRQYMPRFAARINELRKDGYDIETVKDSVNDFRYILHEKNEQQVMI